MARPTAAKLWKPLIGLAFGLVLSFGGLESTGAGHGDYFLFILFGAPFSFLGFFAGLAAPVVLWTLIGVTLNLQQTSWKKDNPGALFLLVIGIHYVGVVVIVSFFLADGFYGVYEFIDEAGEDLPMTGLFLLIYLLGQAGAWVLYLRSRRALRATET